jgi:hypothetical protein
MGAKAEVERRVLVIAPHPESAGTHETGSKSARSPLDSPESTTQRAAQRSVVRSMAWRGVAWCATGTGTGRRRLTPARRAPDRTGPRVEAAPGRRWTGRAVRRLGRSDVASLPGAGPRRSSGARRGGRGAAQGLPSMKPTPRTVTIHPLSQSAPPRATRAPARARAAPGPGPGPACRAPGRRWTGRAVRRPGRSDVASLPGRGAAALVRREAWRAGSPLRGCRA